MKSKPEGIKAERTSMMPKGDKKECDGKGIWSRKTPMSEQTESQSYFTLSHPKSTD